MTTERRLIIPGVIEEIPHACDFVVEAAEYAGLDERAVYHCQMAVDEACTNIIEHGYRHKGVDKVIEVICQHLPDQFVITLLDDSPAFDPLARAEPDPTASLNEREPGGWGIYFIKKLMDEVTYYRAGERNRLVITKKLTSENRVDTEPEGDSIRITPLDRGMWALMPAGRLDTLNSPMLETALADQLKAGHKLLIIDMQGVNYISSSGLKVLVGMWRKAREMKGDIILTGMIPRVREIFEMTGFDLVFPIFTTTTEALAGYNGKQH